MDFFHYIDNLRHWILGLFIPIIYKAYIWVRDKNNQVQHLEDQIEETKNELTAKADENYKELENRISNQAKDTHFKFETITHSLNYNNEQGKEILATMKGIQTQLTQINIDTEKNKQAIEFQEKQRNNNK